MKEAKENQNPLSIQEAQDKFGIRVTADEILQIQENLATH